MSAIFGMITKSKEIEASNKAAVAGYEAINNALIVTQGINWNRTTELTRLIASETGMQIVEAKADITKEISKVAIARGEGVTAGISAARTVSNVLLKSAQAVEGAKQATQSKISDMWAATEDQNYQLQQQKVNAWNKLQASLVTGTQAALQIIGQGVEGAAAAASFASSFGSGGPISQAPGIKR
ncbi:hypothetical protein KAU11_08160 [Candidatus Babeliales bacterium]|nr:hypothetical protein [Candidatus Babeliales bacterium]